jgi:hypothetical protein
MKNLFIVILAIFAGLFASGCAGPMKPLAFPPPIGLQDPVPGSAIVYLIRAPHDSEEITVYLNGILAVVLPSETYTALSMSVGQYELITITRLRSGTPEPAAVPLEVTAVVNERRFFYLSRPSDSSSSLAFAPLGKAGPLPLFSRTSIPFGPRTWKEVAEFDAQGLLSISKVTLPEKNAL